MTFDTVHATAEAVKIESDEDGWELRVETDSGELYVFNIHSISQDLIGISKPIERYWEEARDAAATYVPRPTQDDLDGYALDDPKRIALQREMEQ